MVQEVQRHQPQSHPQSLSDADLLVNAHVQKIEVVGPQIDESGELTWSCGGSIKVRIRLAGASCLIYRGDAGHVGDQSRVREAATHRAQRPLQLLDSESLEESHSRLTEIVDCIASAIEQKWTAGSDGLASAQRPPAYDPIQNSAA